MLCFSFACVLSPLLLALFPRALPLLSRPVYLSSSSSLSLLVCPSVCCVRVCLLYVLPSSCLALVSLVCLRWCARLLDMSCRCVRWLLGFVPIPSDLEVQAMLRSVLCFECTGVCLSCGVIHATVFRVAERAKDARSRQALR